MNREITNVEPLKNYLLHLTYNNGERRHFEGKPILDLGIFKELKDINVFNSVRKSFDTIE